MLHATSSKQQVLLYLQNPKSAYERLINMLWMEHIAPGLWHILGAHGQENLKTHASVCQRDFN